MRWGCFVVTVSECMAIGVCVRKSVHHLSIAEARICLPDLNFILTGVYRRQMTLMRCSGRTNRAQDKNLEFPFWRAF